MLFRLCGGARGRQTTQKMAESSFYLRLHGGLSRGGAARHRGHRRLVRGERARKDGRRDHAECGNHTFDDRQLEELAELSAVSAFLHFVQYLSDHFMEEGCHYQTVFK